MTVGLRTRWGGGLALALVALLVSMQAVAQSAPSAEVPSADPVDRAAVRDPRAARAVMLAAAQADSRLVVAGERGIVLGSEDGGKSWVQAQVPVAVTLTALSFVDGRNGWAVGHGGVVLATRDGGRTWTRQLDGREIARLELEAATVAGNARRMAMAKQLVEDGGDKPLLAVHFWDAKRGMAVGAYGIAVHTEDGGASWQSWAGRIDNPKGLHLNALHVSGSTAYLAGERGLLLRSRDDGQSFQPLPSPYEGSWFAMAGRGSLVVLAGLRGNVFWSEDGGQQWTAARVAAPESIVSATATRSGALLFVNQAGQILRSSDAGRSLQVLPRAPGPPIVSLMESSDGTLLAATFAGAVRLPGVPGGTALNP